MEKEMKERSSESHPSSLEDGRVVTDFDKVKFCQSCGMPLTDDGRFYSDFYPRSFVI